MVRLLSNGHSLHSIMWKGEDKVRFGFGQFTRESAKLRRVGRCGGCYGNLQHIVPPSYPPSPLHPKCKCPHLICHYHESQPNGHARFLWRQPRLRFYIPSANIFVNREMLMRWIYAKNTQACHALLFDMDVGSFMRTMVYLYLCLYLFLYLCL